MVLVSAFWIDRTQVPYRYCQDGVGWERAVVHGKSQPLIPYTTILKVLVRRLRVNCERLGVGEGLDGDVKFGVGTEVAASMSKVWSLEKL